MLTISCFLCSSCYHKFKLICRERLKPIFLYFIVAGDYFFHGDCIKSNEFIPIHEHNHHACLIIVVLRINDLMSYEDFVIHVNVHNNGLI